VSIEHLSRGEVEGAYRRLCAALVAQSAFVLADRGRWLKRNEKKSALLYRQELRRQREAARQWIDGGEAVVPFAEACEALDLSEGGLRAALERFAADPDLTLGRRWRNPDAVERRRAIKAERAGSGQM
jgi:hypothetical protein